MIIGLTGGIATGKSNVSRFLSKHGYFIVDADKITHQVQSKNQPGLKAIIKVFGHRYLMPNDELNRRKLGQFVFARSQALHRLVRVIDPFIRQAVIKRIKQGVKKGYPVVLDAPTLFESGYQYLADQIWTVACDPHIQLTRLQKRDHLSIHDALLRINSQWPLEIKEALADVVINSNGTKLQTLNQVKPLIDRK